MQSFLLIINTFYQKYFFNMKRCGPMHNLLIVSNVTPSQNFLLDINKISNIANVYTTDCPQKVKSLVLEQSIGLVIVNTSVENQIDQKLLKDLSAFAQVIVLVSEPYYDDLSFIVEKFGVITIKKPINRKLLETTVKVAMLTNNRIKFLEEFWLKKLDDSKIINRAKCILIELRGFGENEAHKYIEKEAMNLRKTRKEIAQNIIATYSQSN